MPRTHHDERSPPSTERAAAADSRQPRARNYVHNTVVEVADIVLLQKYIQKLIQKTLAYPEETTKHPGETGGGNKKKQKKQRNKYPVVQHSVRPNGTGDTVRTWPGIALRRDTALARAVSAFFTSRQAASAASSAARNEEDELCHPMGDEKVGQGRGAHNSSITNIRRT